MAPTSPVSAMDVQPKVEPVEDDTAALAGDDTAEDARRYPCSSCGEMNRTQVRKRWYAVTCGLEVGVFEGW
jgi:hypothetical protein